VAQAGKYSVSVVNVYGCMAKDNVLVTFLALPSKNLGQTTSACKIVTLDAGNTGASYVWSNGQTSQAVSVTVSGTYSVTITNSNACSVTDSTQVTVLSSDAVSLGYDITACEGKTVVLDAGTHASEYSCQWNGKTGSGFQFSVTSSGTYVALLTNSSNGCTSSDTIYVQFNQRPVVNLGADRTLCDSMAITLDAGNEGALIQWGTSFGDTYLQQQVTITKAGTYWVTVMNSEGCMGSDTIEVFPSPETLVAEFVAASKAYTGDSIRFVNLSYPSPYTSTWKFGDGVTSADDSPYHVYYMKDTFTVTLTVSSNSCNASLSKPIMISQGYKGRVVDVTAVEETFIRVLHANLYPNPNHGEFTFELQLSGTADVHVYIFNLQGRLLSHEVFKDTDLITKFYSMSNFSAGIYLFRISFGRDAKTYKIIKL
jgi:hypothetical protein